MAFLSNKASATSSWASAAGASTGAAPASNLAAVLLADEGGRRSLHTAGWFDVEFINFSAETWQFISITEGDLKAGIRHQTHEVGRLMYTASGRGTEMIAAREEFTFADPVEDIQKIKKGIITSLRPVTEDEIVKLLTDAGVFDYDKKTARLPVSQRYDYVMQQGRGYQRLDFSMNPKGMRQIATPRTNYKKVKGGIMAEDVTPFLFYLEGVAHNWFNFGNFLFGAAGASLGLTLSELLAGAHYNSWAHSEENGYPSQLDSRDDQLSIRLGFEYAAGRHYTSRVLRQWGKPRTSQAP